MFNISTRRVGGIRFLKVGRLTLSFCVAQSVKPIKGSRRHTIQMNAIRASVAGRRAVALELMGN